MTVSSTKPYGGIPRDLEANFDGHQLVYVSWDHHLLFAAPFLICVPPETTFRELVEGPLAALLAPDPDAAAIDWSKAGWLKANAPFTPDFKRSLKENGITHKSQLRLRTPGLNSLIEEEAVA
ncbi:phenol hydroxylase subunit P4 [Xanthobacter autotrophicus]|uniref:phenol hydroxylase subunit P4 n=1 Tax=Xanthobacter TaxID=279 RepID=UPI0024AC7105|nr:phenol hydroxylase subunit P4 [Xanthobacter autotrophicus]MDI4665630.1 phenol hydroxylase subunit P4 [Xanthobacter autotrophicus]